MLNGDNLPLVAGNESSSNSRSAWWRGLPCLLLLIAILVGGMIVADLVVAKHFDTQGGLIRRAVVSKICPAPGPATTSTTKSAINGTKNASPASPATAPAVGAVPTTSELDSGEAAATFVITCGTQETDAVSEMQPLVKSILMLSSRPIRLIFFTDAEGVTRISKLFSDLGHANRLLRVEIHHVTNEAIEKFAASLKYDPYGHHSGRWGTAKLMVPWLLPNTKRVLVLDTDMILLEDPLHLWAHFDDGKEWTYQMPMHSRGHPANICSCIVLINCERARAQKVYPNIMAQALKYSPPNWITSNKIYRPAHGDQGLYWLMIRKYPKMFRELPRKWDVDKCHRFYGVFKVNATAKASLLHRNCGGSNTDANSLSDEANPFFKFFMAYKWHWLQAPKGQGYKVVVSTFEHAANARINTTNTI